MTIPASQLVSVQPNVISAGGSPLSLNSIFLTKDTSIPIGTAQPFATYLSVANWFGATSPEALLAAVYFNGWDNSTIKPGNLFFSQYNTTAVSAYLRGGAISGIPLTALQSLSGVLSVTVDGVLKTSTAINLSAATSFSSSATIISAAFTAGPAVTFDSLRGAFVVASTTTGATSTISIGSGTIAAGLLLTAATGAVLSQGGAIAVQSTYMNALTVQTQNWACFMTVWEPLIADKLLFASWTNAQNNRYAYVAWDSDITVTQSGNTTSFGPQIIAAGYNSTVCVYPSADKAAFICGTTASIDFTRRNGRITYAFKGQSGLIADVVDPTIANNLTANGYNFYGAYAAANQAFTQFQSGTIPGQWKFFDSYINQIYLNNQLQLALMVLLAGTNSLPYNTLGYGLIAAAVQDPINQALNFGSIRVGVSLSVQQAASVNAQAGLKIDDALTSQGYYFQVLPASAQVRGLRQSPPCTLWYMDGGSIQKINLASIDIL